MPCDFEKYLLNSSYVVLPMKRRSPFSMYGLRMFEASSEPSIFPAPTMLCISSMYIIGAVVFEAPSITSFRRFSKSPRNCVPATMVPMSIMNILLPRRRSGTSPLLMRAARPYTRAVLPTPASPTCSGLFLSLRHNTCMVRSSSRSLPIRGLWRSTTSLRQVTYFCHSSSCLCSALLCSKSSSSSASSGSSISISQSMASRFPPRVFFSRYAAHESSRFSMPRRISGMLMS